MQQTYAEQQQTNVRLLRQLPANISKKATSPFQSKFVNKTSKSAPNRFEHITHTNRQPSPLRRWQTDLDDFNTHRSLSSCPTYSSLSTHSVDTRECATQITTFTPPETFEDDQEVSYRSPLPADNINNQIVLIEEPPLEEVELMPTASGFGHYPYNYPTTKTSRIPKMSKSYHEQFQEKNLNGLNPNPKTNGRQPPPRPTAVQQQSPRSDTLPLLTKRNESKSRDPKRHSTDTVPQQSTTRKPPAKRSSTPPTRRPAEPAQRNTVTRPVQKYIQSPVEREHPARKPVRLVDRQSNAYPPPRDNPKKSAASSSSHNPSTRPHRLHVADNEYVVRRSQRLPEYAHNDHRSHSPMERASARRFVRVVRDPSYHEEDEYDNDVYYVEPARARRSRVIRRPPSREYVYVDEMPPPARHRRRRRSRRAEIVFLDDDDDDDEEEEDGEEYVYVDQHGNEVDVGNDRHHSSRPVQYVYEDDEKAPRHSQKSKVVYVDEDAPTVAEKGHKKKPKQPSSTRIVYK